MNWVSDYGQFGRACRVCTTPDDCDLNGYCYLDLPSGHGAPGGEMPCPAAGGVPCGSEDCMRYGCEDQR